MIVQYKDGCTLIVDGLYVPSDIPPSTVRIRRFAALVFGALAIACVIVGAMFGLSH